MDTDEGMMMVWIYVEEHWFGLKIILISINMDLRNFWN